MAWSMNIDKAENLSSSKGNKLLVGAHRYSVADAKMEVNKNNPSGKEQQVVVDFEREGKIYKQWFAVESANETTAQIAAKCVKSLADACGLKGVLKPERLKSFVGKDVMIEAKETSGKKGTANEGKIFVNIVDITAPEDGEEEEEEETPETEETETEEQEEEKPAATGKGKKPWEK